LLITPAFSASCYSEEVQEGSALVSGAVDKEDTPLLEDCSILVRGRRLTTGTAEDMVKMIELRYRDM